MKHLGLWLGISTLAIASLAGPALADTTVNATALSSCGTMAYPSGQSRAETQDLSGQICNAAPANKFANITSGATTVVKTGAGTLHLVAINTLVGSATLTIYDNTAASGTKIGTVALPGTVTSANPVTLTYDIHFSTGLTIVTSGNTDVTVSYQ